ncbi:hypothetical protein Ddc_13573 [Ditylenchus destructor]|nr:hypothetical protein Ddc_13573 [Ditylenchus destructor]
MRNYQYTPDEERAMDEFAKEWKRNNRGIRGPSAWREFKVRHPWAQRITADALRQKYSRMKRDQYWAAFARRHANCPRGHAVCYAGGIPIRHDYDTVDNEPEQTQAPAAQPQVPTATATPILTDVLPFPQLQATNTEPVIGQAPAALPAVQTTSFHTARDVSPTPRTARSASIIDTARPTTSALASVFTARSPNLTDYNTVHGSSSNASLVTACESPSVHSAVTGQSIEDLHDNDPEQTQASTNIATARSSSEINTSQKLSSTSNVPKVQNTGLASNVDNETEFCGYFKLARKLQELANKNEDNLSAEGSLPNLLRSGVMHSVLDNLKSYLIDEFDKLFKACLVLCGLPSNATIEKLHESRSALRTAVEQLSVTHNDNVLASLGCLTDTITVPSPSNINTARSTNSACSAQTPGLVTCIDDESSGERLCNYVKRLMRLYQLMSGKKMCIVTVGDKNKEVEGADLAAMVRIFEEPLQTAIDQVRNLLSDSVGKMLRRYEAHFDPIAEGVLPNLVRSGVMRELLDHLKKYLFHEFDKFVLAALDSVKRNNH